MPNPKAPLCDCRVLERAAAEPANPIIFDSKLNEYRIRCGDNGYMSIYHCPFCGGRVPESKRKSLFAILTHRETLRLGRLTSKYSTLAEVLQAFGPPDEDHPTGEGIGWPEKEGKAGTFVYFRSLLYKNLSKTADVRVRVYADNRVGFSFSGKHLKEVGPKQSLA